MGRDHYAALETSPHATADEIKKAYRRLVREFHPDAQRSEAAKDRFHQIQEAYEVLSDPKKRASYDHQRRGHGVATYRQNQAAAAAPRSTRAATMPQPPLVPAEVTWKTRLKDMGKTALEFVKNFRR